MDTRFVHNLEFLLFLSTNLFGKTGVKVFSMCF